MSQRLGSWRGGGMGPRNLDRGELRTRLADEAPGWVIDDLADAFEPAFLTFQRRVAEADRKAKRRGGGKEGRERRSRQGKAQDEED